MHSEVLGVHAHRKLVASRPGQRTDGQRVEDQQPTGSRLERLLLASYFRRHAPGAGRSHRVRHHRCRQADVALGVNGDGPGARARGRPALIVGKKIAPDP